MILQHIKQAKNITPFTNAVINKIFSKWENNIDEPSLLLLVSWLKFNSIMFERSTSSDAEECLIILWQAYRSLHVNMMSYKSLQNSSIIIQLTLSTVVVKWRLPSYDLRTALRKLATRCRLIVSSWTRTKRSFSGPGHVMVRVCQEARVRPCGWEPRRSWRVIRSVSLTCQWRQTCFSTSTLPTFVQRTSIGFISSDRSDVHSMRSLRLCWSTRLWRHTWTIATPLSLWHPSL